MAKPTRNLFRKRPKSRKMARRTLRMRSFGFSNQLHYHKVTYYGTDEYSITNVNSILKEVVTFSLSDVPNSSEFVALYDCFKIRKVVVEIIPQYKTIMPSSNSAPGSTFPGIMSAIDYNDATTPVNVSELCQYNTFKQTRGGMVHKRVILPRYQLASNLSGTLTNIAESRQNWLNTNTGTVPSPVASTVPHFGLKWMTDQYSPTLAADESINFDYKVTYYLVFKNTK